MANTSKVNQRIITLKHKQRVFQSNITALTTFLTDYQESAIARTKLRERVNRLKKQYEIFNDNQDELGLHGDFDQIEAERESVTQLYENVIANATQLLEGVLLTHGQTDRSTTDSPVPSTSTSAGIRLPKINLPHFDGNLEKWLTFKNAFISLIQGHSGLTDIQRFNYLRLSVSGKAKDAIESFTISEANYKAAWAQLLETYDNKRALILRHTSMLLNTPPMHDDSPDAITDLINHTQSHFRSLQSLGRSKDDIADDFLASIMIDRMHDDTRKVWEQTLIGTEMPSPTEIIKYLRNASHQCNTRVKAIQAKPVKNTLPESQPSARFRPRVAKRRWEPATTAKETSSSYVPNKRTFVTTTTAAQTCKICKSNTHQIYTCPKFENMPVNDRWSAVRAETLCYNCLRPNHTVDFCTRSRCRVCNGKHNTKLHTDQKPKTPAQKA